ncbi:MAG: hypothetical protein ACEQSA_06680, partial [Weeksellaceae bacterium]
EKRGDSEFWHMIRKEMFTDASAFAVSQYLLERVITSDWNKLPENEYQDMIDDIRQSSEEQFIEAWDGEECDTAILFRLYREYCIDNELPHSPNVIALGRKLAILVRNGIMKTKKKERGRVYFK